MTYFRLIFTVIASTVLFTVSADELLSKQPSLPEIIKHGVQRNPGLKAARQRWGAALQRMPQAGALPDPMIEYGYFEESVETRVGPQKHKIGIAQPFPFPGTLGTAAKVQLEAAHIAQIQHEMTLRDLIVDLKVSYHELAYFQRAIVITRQNKQLMAHAVTLAQNLYAKEEATLNDVLKAQAQAAQLEYDLVLLRELEEVEKARLLSLLDLPTDTEVGRLKESAPQEVAIDYDALEKQALADRQELKIAEHKIKQAKHKQKLAKLKRLPQFKVSVATVITDDAQNPNLEDSGKDPVIFGLGVTLPWNLRKTNAAIKEAELTRQAAENSKRDAENKTRALLKRMYFQMLNARRLIALYEKTLIPQAKKAMQTAETWNVDGQKNLSGFLETQSVWLNFNLARLRAVTDYKQSIARLERLAGGSLDE